MRKQYHFRRSERGLLSWDVDRLITLARGRPVEKIPLAQIQELDQPYWFEHGEVLPSCRAIVEHMRLTEEADLSHPIILCSQGRVMDGMHRVAKALYLGRDEITAVRLPTDPEPDFVDRAPEDLPY